MNGQTKRFGLQAWLVAAFVAVGAIASLAVSLVVLPALESNIRQEQQQATIQSLARLTTQRFPPGNAQNQVEFFANQFDGDVRLSLVEELGPLGPARVEVAPAASSMTRGYLQDRVLTQAGEEVLLEAGRSPRIVLRRVDGIDRIEWAHRVLLGGEPAVLEIAAPVRGVAARVSQIRRRVLLAVTMVLGLATFAGVWISRLLGHRISRLAGTAATLARGDLSARADEVTPNELASLGESLNAMAARLEGLVAETVSDRDRAHALVSSLAEGVLAVSAHGEVTVANDAAQALLGIPVGADRVRVHELPQAVRDAVDSVDDPDDAGRLVEATLPGGAEVLIQATPAASGAGVVVTVRDVTEDRKLTRARRDLIANVSHELKTPLTAVKGFLELLEDDRMTPERRAEFLNLMGTEVGRLERLVAEQLELARLDAGALSLEREPVDLGEIAAEVTATRQALAAREGVDLVASRPTHEVVVDADPARIEQILLILLDNAIRHTPEGGKITVGVGADAGFGTMSIRDTGSGVPLDAQQFIFDRFFQADASREGRGLGLGLAIARGLAAAHGGSIEVRSAPGVGSVFTVRLPRAPVEATSPVA